MSDVCEEVCSGLTCADYAPETCAFAHRLDCLCAGCDCQNLRRLLGNATAAVAPPLPSADDGGNGDGLALWSSIAAVIVAVGGASAVAWLYGEKADGRAAVASLAAVAVVIVVVIGQGLIAFDVEFDYAVAADTVFDGYDFWAGVSELWRRDAKFLAVVAGGSSGVWPLLKNALTFFTCWFGGDAGRKSRIFRLLGLGGKTAILDIAFIALLVTQNARAPRLRRVS